MSDQGWFVTPTVSNLGIHSGPNDSNKVLQRLNPGEALRIMREDDANGRSKIGVQGQWLAVSGKNAVVGFVPAWQVEEALIRKPDQMVPPTAKTPEPSDPWAGKDLLRVFPTVDTGLRVRSGPTTGDEQVGLIRPNEVVDVLEDKASAKQKLGQNGQWFLIRTADGLEGYTAAWYLYEEGTQPPAPPEPPQPAYATFSEGHALAGIHGPADPGAWPWDDGAIGILTTAGMEAAKVLAWGDLGANVVTKLQQNGIKFVMARIFHKFPDKKTPQQFVDEVSQSVRQCYSAGVRYFEVHNEPNLHFDGAPEGMWVVWQNGKEFGDFFLESVKLLKAQFPEGKFGWPGVSPGFDASITPGGPLVRYDSARFLDEAEFAIKQADWVGMHTYWGQGGTTLHTSLSDCKAYCDRFPDKVIFATEFSNNAPGVDKAAKGDEYAQFYQEIKNLPSNFGGAFSFVMSASAGFPEEIWRDSAIAQKVGLKLSKR